LIGLGTPGNPMETLPARIADTGCSSIWSRSSTERSGEGSAGLRTAESLGWSFATALGAKCAAPHRKVICWPGDRALYDHLTDLETVRPRDIAIALTVDSNADFAWEDEHSAPAGDGPGDVAEPVRFGPVNFAEVLQVFGLHSTGVEGRSLTGPALRAPGELVVAGMRPVIDCRAPEPWLPEEV
jgi:acetolactate synthase I/II/III large subunit